MSCNFDQPGGSRPRARIGIEATVLLSIRHPALRIQIHQFLHELGLKVVEAPGREDPNGLTAETCGRIDLWLTDRAAAPELASTREALRNCPGVTVLALTANPRRAARTVPPQVRVSFIETPFAWRDLAERITELLMARLRARVIGWGSPDPTSIVIVTGLPSAYSAGEAGC
jgi:hypothetical protein